MIDDLSGSLSGKTIYDEIEEEISGFISSEYGLTSGQILTELEIPEIEEELFARFMWTYGNLTDISNLSIQELPNLNIEVYERKNNGHNYCSSLVRDFRYALKKNFNVKIYDGEYVKISEIYISKHDPDPEWSTYVITISFRILKAR